MRQSRRKPGFCGSVKTSSCGSICFTGYFRASLSWMLCVFLSRHQTARGQHKEHVGCYDANGRESWVPTPMMGPPRHPGAPSHDSEEGHISSSPPRALSARPWGRACFGDATNAPCPGCCSSKWEFLRAVTFLTPSGD